MRMSIYNQSHVCMYSYKYIRASNRTIPEMKFYILMVQICSEEAKEDEDFVGKAEQDFWDILSNEQKNIEAKEVKRQEAIAPKNQPTPIPEEGDKEQIADS